MFGIDWDGDGEDTLFDDILTMDILEDHHGGGGGGNKGGGCLSCFLMIIGVPVLLMVGVFYIVII